MAFKMDEFLQGLLGGQSPLLAAAQRQQAGRSLGMQAGRTAAPGGLEALAAGGGAAGGVAGRAGNGRMGRKQFMDLLNMDIPGFDAGDQARAYAAAGAPKIDPKFAQLVANADPATMAFIEAIKRGGM